MTQDPKIKKTAIFIIVIYSCLSGLLVMEAGEHLLKHHRSSSHQGKYRVSLNCKWMCGTLTPLQPSILSFDFTRLPLVDRVSNTNLYTRIYNRTSDHPGRAPPCPKSGCFYFL